MCFRSIMQTHTHAHTPTHMGSGDSSVVLQIHHANTHIPTHMGSGDSSVVLQIHHANTPTRTHSHTHGEWGQLSGASDPSCKHTHTRTLPHTCGVGTAQWCFRSIMQTHTHTYTHVEWGQLSCASDPSCKHTHTHNIWGAGTAQWLEHRTRDWKVPGSSPACAQQVCSRAENSTIYKSNE